MADVASGVGSAASMEAFLSLLGTTRGAVSGLQGQADIQNDALNEQATGGVGRLQDVRDGLIAAIETLTTAQQDAAGELGTLAEAATVLADRRFSEVRDKLGDSQAAFAAAVKKTRDGLQDEESELKDEFAEAESTITSLEEQLSVLESDEEQAFTTLAWEIQDQSQDVASAAAQLDEVLEATSSYLLEGLEDYMEAAFETLYYHLRDEDQAVLVDTFSDLNRGFTRALDDFDALVLATGDELVETTEPTLHEAVRTTEDKQHETEDQVDRSVERSLEPFTDDVERNINVVEHGEEVVRPLPQMAPQLAAAREVAEHVQELTYYLGG